MCLKHNKYCIEPTFPSVAPPQKNRPKKHRKMRPKTHLNRSKIGPRRLPNEASKNNRSRNPYFHRLCRFLARFGPPVGTGGGEKLTIWSPERSKRNLGAKMHPRCSQDPPRMVPRPPQSHFGSFFGQFFVHFGTLWDHFWAVFGAMGRQSDRETDRETERPEEQQRQRDGAMGRQSDRETDRETETRRDRETENQRDRETESQRVRGSESQRVRETQTQRDRETRGTTETERQRAREPDTETQRQTDAAPGWSEELPGAIVGAFLDHFLAWTGQAGTGRAQVRPGLDRLVLDVPGLACPLEPCTIPFRVYPWHMNYWPHGGPRGAQRALQFPGSGRPVKAGYTGPHPFGP